MQIISLLPTLGFVSVALAAAFDHDSLYENIAYRSPSKTVSDRGLAHDVDHIASLAKRAGSKSYSGNLTFPYGVASGDPYDTSIILWTHPIPAKKTSKPICLEYEVSKSSTFKKLVSHGKASTTTDVDYSYKIEAKGLKALTNYYYRFVSCENAKVVSPVGRFKTLPAKNQDIDSVSFDVFSCSNLPVGFFNAYAAAVKQDVDYTIHVGDYLYEKGGNNSVSVANGRVPSPDREITSLTDYRQRWGSYRSIDAGLRALHARRAFIHVWDDHEVADNSWKNGSADSNNTKAGEVNGVTFSERKKNAVKAYFEWMPTRQVDTTDDLRIWRKFNIGKLADLTMLDTRQYSRDVTDVYYNTADIAKIANDTDRTLMGGRQEKWLYKGLKESQDSGVTWKIIGQQIIVDQLIQPGGSEDLDAWDGYKANRRRLFDAIDPVDNVVLLAGDSHAAWVYDSILPENNKTYNPATGKGSVAVEFAGTAVSSTSSYGSLADSDAYTARAVQNVRNNINLQFAEGEHRGYFSLHFSKTELNAKFWGIQDNNVKDSPAFLLATFNVKKGANKLTRPINGGKAPAAGALQAQEVNYKTEKYNGTTFA